MPGGTLQVLGDIVVNALPGVVSGTPFEDIPINLTQVLSKFHHDEVTLIDASTVAVSFGGLAQATCVMVAPNTGQVDVIVTTVDGAAQKIPVDQLYLMLCQSKPVTALSLSGQVGQTITCDIFLGTL